MESSETSVPGVLVLTPTQHHDERGFLSEVYNKDTLASLGVNTQFAQENHIYSESKGTIRGLHYQMPPSPVAKLVRVVSGAIYDVALDMRIGSPSFGRHHAELLSAENWRQLYLPAGTAHGFCTVENRTEVVYMSSVSWEPHLDRSIRWNDPELGVEWPLRGPAHVSEKDSNAHMWAEVESPFFYENR